MYRRPIVSLFFVLGLLAFAASGQQPVQPPAKAKEATTPSTPGQPGAPGLAPGKGAGDAGGTKQADPGDALVNAALVHDPDVRMAQAKIQLAEAELAKAKQVVVLKVLTLNATIQELKSQVAAHTKSLQIFEGQAKAGVLPQEQVQLERRQLESAKNALAKAEMELKLLTGGMQKEAATNPVVNSYPLLTNWNYIAPSYRVDGTITWAPTYSENQSAKGPISDRIQIALDKTVKLGPKGEQVTLAKALEIFKKDAGLDVPVRVIAKVLPITSEGEELPVGAWFQLFHDNNPGSVRVYVREYGLLVTLPSEAPPNALTVTEFWKRPVKKDPEPKPKAQTDAVKP